MMAGGKQDVTRHKEAQARPMTLKILLTALGAAAVLAFSACEVHAAYPDPSAASHSGAINVAAASVNTSTVGPDGIGWD
jgi:hypothetical protein